MFLQNQTWQQRQRIFVHDDLRANSVSKMGLLEEPTLVQLWLRMGRGQFAAASSGTHSPSEACRHKRPTENPMHCIFISDNRPGSWQLEHYKQCEQILAEHRSEFPESMPAPCKQLSRQKNSTNSIAEVR